MRLDSTQRQIIVRDVEVSELLERSQRALLKRANGISVYAEICSANKLRIGVCGTHIEWWMGGREGRPIAHSRQGRGAGDSEVR